MNDEALIAAYAKGQTDAFECLYLRHKRALFAFLRRQCSSSSIAEELAHDAWLAVINQAAVFKPNAKFKTWLYRIAHNRLVDYWRKHGSVTGILFDEISEQLSLTDDTSTYGLELDELVKKVNDLSHEQTTTLLLKVEGFSYSEIANITQTKQETVKSRLRYATQHLRMAMEVSS